jgi:hypothetical protein
MLQNYHLFALNIRIFSDMPKDIIITLLTLKAGARIAQSV